MTRTVLVTMIVAGLASSASAAPQVEASLGNNVATVANAVTLHNGEQIDGLLPFTAPLHIEVSLKARNKDALDNFVEASAHPNILLTQAQIMSSEQFLANHSPSPEKVQQVVDFLTSAGFKNIEVSGNRLMISADGTADAAQSAFQTSFASIKTADGRSAYANTDAVHIPAALQDTVLAVLGLQNVHLSHTMLIKAAHPNAVTGHNPTDWAPIYGATSLPTGAGISVGIITQGKVTQTVTDLNTFTSQNGYATASTQTVVIGTASSDTAGVDEWNLDSQDILAMAGGALQKIYFYDINSLTSANLSAGYSRAVSDNVVKVINVSIGGCETDSQQDGSAATDDQTFQTAIAQGQTFSISSGDSGADECGDGGTTPSWPASSRYVVAVGGTSLNASTGTNATWTSEVVWNDSTSSSTGGSPSKFESKPTWQTSAIVSGNFRGVPDVAFSADPNSGAKIIVNGSSTQVGGTSLASPIFVGAWVRLLAAKGNLGFAAPLLYQLPAADFHDVTSGNNNGETAHAGWDFTTGFGSMILSKVVADIGGGSGTTPDFSLSDSPSAVTVAQSASGSTTISVADVGGFTGSVALTASGLPSGVTAAFSPASTTTSSTLTLTASATATAGNSTVTITGVNGSLSHTATVALTVTPTGTGGGNVLSNGVAITGLSGTTGTLSSDYTFTVPTGATAATVAISGGTGDADMYVQVGAAPTLTSYSCRPYVTGNNESCTLTAGNTYHIKLNAYATYSGVSLLGKFTPASGGGGGGNTLTNGVAVTGLSGTKGTLSAAYIFTVPAGATAATVAISGGTGDADMYVQVGADPTLSSYSCRPYVTGNSESCTLTAGNTYHIKLNAYATYSGVSLLGKYTP